MTIPEDAYVWVTSSYSANGSECVEVRQRMETIDVRDTKNRAAGHIGFTREAWSAFLDGAAGRDSR